VELSVAPGETLALVGPSGAGKTTILSLLPRFYEVEAGRITVDGTDIREMTLASLRGQIGIVQQDAFLFAGTLRENIAYGRLGATEAEVLDAARRARLEEVIAGLPAGLDTVVGERGVKLSGGQRQRIAIARAILRDPAILVLDEATSMVDAESEAQIAQTLAEFSKGRTCLVVAHRLSTVLSCDRIVVMDAGQVVDQGQHAELMGRCGLYRQLAGAQLGVGQEEHAVGRA
jgi:ATP-binding cassette, subfamily B, bacterial